MKINWFSAKARGCIISICLALGAQSLILATINKAADTNTQFASFRPPTLESLTDSERETFAQTIAQNLHGTQEALVKNLNSTNMDVRFYASYLLGEYRFARASNDLARNISLEDKARGEGQSGRLWFWSRYPAMEALVKIGNSSIPSMLRNLEESDDVIVRDLSLKVVSIIDGDKQVTKLRLQHALDAQKDLKQQARLQLALKSLM